MTPIWLVNASWSWGHNDLNDTPAAPDVYSVTDLLQRTLGHLRDCTGDQERSARQFVRQGLGFSKTRRAIITD